jgi:hypothetical protein
MKAVLLHVAGVAFAIAATLALAGLSHAPYPTRPGQEAAVRLAWSGRPERIETCRAPSKEELEKLPAHMRLSVVCEGTSARYRLRVSLNGTPVVEQIIRGTGLRHDRPIYLLREFPTPPGRYDLEVGFERIDSLQSGTGDSAEVQPESLEPGADIPGRAIREAEERRRRRSEAMPPELRLSESIVLAPGAVVLISYDAERRRLVRISPTPPPWDRLH